LTGAVLGSFGYVFLAVIIQSTGNPAVGSKTGSGDLVYAALAFIIGFSQKTFHDLLERATAVIFGPGDGIAARPAGPGNQGAGDQQGPGGGAAGR
jgi:hydroxyethylthiazole kinase-like sugar kinase family protein